MKRVIIFVGVVVGIGFNLIFNEGEVYAAIWETFNFECITNNSIVNSVAGEKQLLLDITTDNVNPGHTNGAPSSAFFRIRNAGSEPMVISHILFDFPNDFYSKGDVLFDQSIDNIALHNPIIPSVPLPGYNTLDLVFSIQKAFIKFPASSYNDEYGLEPGESQLIELNFYPTITADYGIGDAIMSHDFRVGLYVEGFSDGGNESFVTVPEPATLSLLIMGGITLIKYRKVN